MPLCEVSAFGSILKYCNNNTLIETVSSGCVSEVAAIGRCPLQFITLHIYHLCSESVVLIDIL